MGLGSFLHSSFPGGALVGGLVGLISSGAANVRKYKEGDIEPGDAGIAVGKEAVGTGVATGVATAAATTFGHSILIMTGTALVVGVAVKYLWDVGVERYEEKRSEADG